MSHTGLRIILGTTLMLVLACGSIGTLITHAQSSETLIAERRAQLEKELAHLEQLIDQQQALLSDKRTERVSLERDLAIIDAEIAKARIAIRAQEATIATLEREIVDRHATILEIDEKLSAEKESLASLLRRTAEMDETSLVEIVLSDRTFSDFFEEIDDFEEVNIALQTSFKELALLRLSHENVKQGLEQRKLAEGELRELQQLQRKKLESQEAEKARILKATKGEEANYQELIATNERSAAQIRSELFELRGSAAINLGDAIEFANFAGAKTGVRPALILGVLKQETRLGEFLGNGNWKVDMHPTRDRILFQVITKTLGLNPDTMPVSAAPSYGYGGAMGPAQFIPSTWACYGGYVNTNTNGCSNRPEGMSWDTFWAGPWEYRAGNDRLRTVRGKQSPSNPWDNQDAFIAAGILMMDNGAAGGNPANERTAALRYFAGWGNASNPAYAFYGDGVMEHAAYFQRQIDTLKQLSQ